VSRILVLQLLNLEELSRRCPAARMAAVAGDLSRILGGFAVWTAILAVIPGHASTTRVCAFLFIVGHLFLLRGPRITSVRFMVGGKSRGRQPMIGTLSSPTLRPPLTYGTESVIGQGIRPPSVRLRQVATRRQVCRPEARTPSWGAGLWPALAVPAVRGGSVETFPLHSLLHRTGTSFYYCDGLFHSPGEF
jgi:hypothetical protein